MKIYFSTDLEGVASVTALEQVKHGSPEFADTRKLFTAEVNAAIEGALSAGADQFLVNEGHGKHRNILPEKLHRKAKLITGRNKMLHLMQGIDEGHDGMFMVGFHVGPGSKNGVLGHTFHAFNLRVNDQPLTEVGLCMGLAGYYEVPTLLVTGDAQTCQDALTLTPDIESAAVKEAISGNSAKHMHPLDAQDLIREKAAKAVEKVDDIDPFFIEHPYVMDIDLYSTLMADMNEYTPGCERTGSRSIRLHTDDYEELFKLFLLSSTLSMTAYGLSVMV